MTEPTTPDPASPGPSDADAELASALHDGEAAADERARADDAAVQAQRRRMAAVAAQVGEVPPPPAGLVDDQVAAALAAFDDAGEAEPAPVVDLAERRSWWQRTPLGAVAAALAVVALVGAIGFAAITDDDDADTTAAATFDDDSADSSAEAGAGPGVRSDDAPTIADVPERLEDADSGPALEREARRAYASIDELVADVEAAWQDTGSDGATPEVPGAGVDPEQIEPESTLDETTRACDAIGAAGIDPGRVRLATAVLVDGQPVTVVVHGDDDGAATLVVVDEGRCAVVDERTL